MDKLKNFFLFSWIILIPFQDSGLQALPIGFLGSSIAFIPLCMVILLSSIEYILITLKSRKALIQLSFALILIYMVIITFIYTMITYFTTHSLDIYGRNIVIKSLNLFILTYLFVYPIFFVKYNKPDIKYYIYTAFYIAIFGVIVCDLLKIGLFSDNILFHFTPFEVTNMRPRGFSLESSWLSTVIITLGLLSSHFAKKTRIRIIFILAMCVTLIISNSKGGLVSLVVVMLIVSLFKAKLTWIKKIIFLPITGMILYFVYEFLSIAFMSDIEQYTSIATRSSGLVTAILIVVKNPFGVGFSGFLPAMNSNIPIAVEYIDAISNVKLDFSEIMNYVDAANDAAINTKTFLFDFCSFFGIPFLILFIRFNYNLYKRLSDIKNVFLLSAFLYSLIALSSYNTGLGFYNISLVYGVAFHEAYRKEVIGRSTRFPLSS